MIYLVITEIRIQKKENDGTLVDPILVGLM